MGRLTVKFYAIIVATLLAIQFIPYGHQQINPPVISEPKWHSSETRGLAKRACFDCHSNESVWPWYSRIAPVSWLVFYDVQAGRKELNFSDWQRAERTAESIKEMVTEIGEGEMPPPQYLLTHPEARLTDSEKQQLITGLQATGRN